MILFTFSSAYYIRGIVDCRSVCVTIKMARTVPQAGNPKNRGSFGGSGGHGQTSIESLLTSCNNQIETLAQRVQRDCAQYDVPPATMKRWKDKLMQFSKESASLGNAQKVTKTLIESELDRIKNKRPRQDAGSSSSTASSSRSSSAENTDGDGYTAANIAEEINSKIESSLNNFDASAAPIVKKIREKFADVDDDEDIVLVNEELNEATFTCPITAMKIVDPMTNGLCPHTVSRAGITSLMRGIDCKCPMPGCDQKWTKSNTQPDPAFEDKMDRFYRKQSQASAFATANRVDNAINLDDDDEIDL